MLMIPKTVALPWTLEFGADARAQLLAHVSEVKSGRPSPALATRLLVALQRILRHGGRPRFLVCTIDRIHVGPLRLYLSGRCAPLILEAFGAGGRANSVKRSRVHG